MRLSLGANRGQARNDFRESAGAFCCLSATTLLTPAIMGDRADVIFADPQEIGSIIFHQCRCSLSSINLLIGCLNSPRAWLITTTAP